MAGESPEWCMTAIALGRGFLSSASHAVREFTRKTSGTREQRASSSSTTCKISTLVYRCTTFINQQASSWRTWVMKDIYVPPWPAYEQHARFNLLGDSTNQVKKSMSEFLSKKDSGSSSVRDGNLVHQNAQGGESNSQLCSVYKDPAVNGTDLKDITSSGTSTCKPLGDIGVHVPKVKFVSWWKGKEIFSESWIGKLLPLKSPQASLLPNYKPMVQKETCGLATCAVCFPSEESQNDHESDFEDHLYCLLEEGYAGLGKFEKPAFPIRPKSDFLVAATQLAPKALVANPIKI